VSLVLERAEVIIKPGMMDEFIDVFKAQVLPLTAQFAGCLSFKAVRGVEDADSMMMLAEWESLEAHLSSRTEPAHAEFRRLVLPYASGAKQTVHFEAI
jgi:quinol monooxygenase YgiN